jgi:hypothetical protein
VAAGSSAPHVQVVSTNPNGETVRLSSDAPVRLVRDVAWDAGWHAMVSVDGGPAHHVNVSDYRLVQEVRLPPGRLVVTFEYRPKHVLLASLLTSGALAFLLLLGIVTAVRRWRRHAVPAPTLI